MLQVVCVVYNTEYVDKVKFAVLCEVDSSEGFVKHMTDISGGCADISDGGFTLILGLWAIYCGFKFF